MTKQQFLNSLKSGLCGLPQDDIEERILFYSEMIDDHVENGLSEEQAVLAVGSVDEIVKQVIEDIPLTKLAKERIIPKRRLTIGEITLLALGSPIWLSLGIALISVIISLYLSLWAIIVSLWAVFGSLLAGAGAGLIGFVLFIFSGNGTSGFFMFSACLVCVGLSIFTFYGCKALTKYILILTKKIVLSIKNSLIKKEVA